MIRVGDKVKLKTYNKQRRPYLWNDEGRMDKYMGRVVTVTKCNDITFRIKESVEEDGREWSFNYDDIELVYPKVVYGDLYMLLDEKDFII